MNLRRTKTERLGMARKYLASQMSRKDFATQEGIGLGTLKAWVTELGHESSVKKARKPRAQSRTRNQRLKLAGELLKTSMPISEFASKMGVSEEKETARRAREEQNSDEYESLLTSHAKLTERFEAQSRLNRFLMTQLAGTGDPDLKPDLWELILEVYGE